MIKLRDDNFAICHLTFDICHCMYGWVAQSAEQGTNKPWVASSILAPAKFIKMIRNEDRIIAACSYIFFFPALYLALTDRRKIPFDATHAAQSILLWTAFAAIYILLRIIYAFLSGVWYFILYDLLIKAAHISMWGYAIYRGFLALNDQKVDIPYISNFAKKLL